MQPIPEELYSQDKLCDECHNHPALWVENEDRPYDERVYLCGKCAREYHMSILD